MERTEYEKILRENEKLKQENEKWKQYVIHLSHRLRTPLNAISGITSIIKTCKDRPDEVLECVNKIDFASQMLINIVGEVAEFSAMVDNELPIYNSRFDFKLFLSSVSSMFFQQCSDNMIDYDIFLENVTEEDLVGDSMRLNQILFSMLGSATAATIPGGKIELRVSQTKMERSSVMTQFSITDTGCGFTESELEELWSITGSKKTEVSLAVTKRLVELMGGSVTAKSEPEKGTCITVTIPFVIASETDTIADESLTATRVLIIGSDEETRRSVCELLKRVGADYTCVANTEEAIYEIEAAENGGCGYGLCFADWSNTDDDIMECIESLRYCAGGSKLFLAVVIEYDISDMRNAARAAGADAILAKPIFQSTVFNILVEISGKMFKKTHVERGEFDLTGSCVLLCEDNELNAELALELLNAAGLEVDCAMNGEDAVMAFEASEPGTYDAVLMDIQMPIKNGFEATREIRALDREDAKKVPIIALTADAFASDIAEARSSGMNDYIVKPIDTLLLYQTLERNIRHE